MAWNFKRENTGFTTRIPEGANRIRIKAADKAVSSKGNDMLVLQFDVSGYADTVYHYITFMPDKPEITNRNLTQFFDAFEAFANLKDDELMNTTNWIGKVGACIIKHEEYNDNVNAKVERFIHYKKQGDLPPWKEVATGGSANPLSTPNADGFMAIPDNVDERLPF